MFQGKGFTLIELLIVVAILAVLVTTTAFILNPTEAIEKTRDEQRIKDLDTIKGVLILYQSIKGPFDLGGSCTPTDPCQSNEGASPANISGSGWIPLDFASLPGGSPISRLSIDPLNNSTYYYTFAVEGSSFELNCSFESKYYNEEKMLPQTDGGNDDTLYEVGTDLEILGEGGAGGESNFVGKYFNNINLAGEPDLIREDIEVNFNWGSGSPAPEINSNNFSVRWTKVASFTAGNYRFSVTVDDGVRLYVDGELIINSWKDQSPTTYTADKTLTKGNHNIKMEYYERGGGAVARLSWQGL